MKEKKELAEHFYSTNLIALSEDDKTSVIEVLRVGTIQDRGLKITPKMLSAFIENFKNDAYGTELQVNLGHNGTGEAGGWIKDLFLNPMDDTQLMAKVEWTILGEEKISNKLYKFVSAEFAPKYKDAKTGKITDNVFTGLALTNIPALKGQSPIMLAEIKLINQNIMFMKTFISALKEREIVSKIDKELMRTLLSELSEAEQEEVKEDVATVEAKPEEEKEDKTVEPVTPATPAKEEPKEDATPEQLSEKLNETSTLLAEERAARIELQEKIERNELSEEFTKTYQLSQDTKTTTGLTSEHKDSFVDFMMTLDADQRTKFSTLFSAIKTVNLEEIGVDASKAGDATKIDDAAVAAKAAEMTKENGKPLHENLAELYSKTVKA
jgi:cell division septation protein DedD